LLPQLLQKFPPAAFVPQLEQNTVPVRFPFGVGVPSGLQDLQYGLPNLIIKSGFSPSTAKDLLQVVQVKHSLWYCLFRATITCPTIGFEHFSHF